MSRAVLQNILALMLVRLDDSETDELYRELVARFSLVGASDQCQALESAWMDPYNRQRIEEFIKAWLRKKAKPIAGLV